MDRDSMDRIRSATFPIGRRGYEKREVDRFLNGIADWLEAGGGDQARAELVRRDLERVGEQTAKILTDANEAGERLRAEAEHEAAELTERARAEAERTREHADEYAAETRGAAEADAEQAVGTARAEAQRIVDEANRRRGEIETVISDLEQRRDSALADIQRLSTELAGSATQHRAAAAAAEPRAEKESPPASKPA